MVVALATIDEKRKKFKDDTIVHIVSDIAKIQETAQMYIGYSGSRGAFHLGKEGVNNAIDECINPDSPGNEVHIYLDEAENELIVSDNGRGIPFDDLMIVCTKLQSSGKFKRKGVGNTAGQNGVGITAENALSETFEIISHRYGEKANIKFEQGLLVQDIKIVKDKGDKHGTTVKFKPSKIFLGEECNFNADDIAAWLEDIISMVPDKVTIIFTVTRKGKESVATKKFRNKDGMYTVCKRLIEKPTLDPIHFLRDMKATEIIQVRNDETGEFTPTEIQRFIGLEVAFTYDSTHTTDLKMKSFCNFVVTVDHGEHANGVRTGMLNYFAKQTRESLSEKDSKTIDIIPNDVTNGLGICLYLATDMTPEFGGQAKEKLNSTAFFRPLREMTYRALEEHFKKEPKDLKKITDYIKANAKARLASNKERNSVLRGETNNLGEHEIKFFCPANNKGRNDYRELFIVEGESAFGPAKRGRFSADFQAIFGVRGYGLNSFGVTSDVVLDNKELRELIAVLGCNIGTRFDISKLKYRKIIIMTDGDTDGFFIFSLLCAFFSYHLPEIVKQGYLYKAVAPLYQTNDKKKKFLMNKNEFIKLFEERIGDNIRLIDPVTNIVLKDKNLREFLMINREYLEELQRVSGHYAISPDLMEHITIHADEIGFKSKLRKKYPEMEVDDDNILSGIHEGRYQILNMDKLLFNRIGSLKQLMFGENKGKLYYMLHEKTDKGYIDRGVMTIGGILTQCVKFRPKTLKRFKGLGELNYDQLGDTTLDPNKRLLIQLTTNDLSKEIEKFKMLHGDEKEELKEFLSDFKPSRDDLDN